MTTDVSTASVSHSTDARVWSGKLHSVQVVDGKRRGLRLELDKRGNRLLADV
jgi:hypothetical protein